MAVDLSSYAAFKKTAPPANMDGLKHIGEGRWTYKGGPEFETPGEDDRSSAAAYGAYLRRCAKKGVEPGPFTG